MAADMDIDFTRRNKKPRPLTEHEKEKLDEFIEAIHYSARYVCLSQPRTVQLLTRPSGIRTSSTSIATCSSQSRCSSRYPKNTSTGAEAP